MKNVKHKKAKCKQLYTKKELASVCLAPAEQALNAQ